MPHYQDLHGGTPQQVVKTADGSLTHVHYLYARWERQQGGGYPRTAGGGKTQEPRVLYGGAPLAIHTVGGVALPPGHALLIALERALGFGVRRGGRLSADL